MNEADTCRIYVEPTLRTAGWETPPHLTQAELDALLPEVLDRAFRGGI
jgi:hypothetical protein